MLSFFRVFADARHIKAILASAFSCCRGTQEFYTGCINDETFYIYHNCCFIPSRRENYHFSAAPPLAAAAAAACCRLSTVVAATSDQGHNSNTRDLRLEARPRYAHAAAVCCVYDYHSLVSDKMTTCNLRRIYVGCKWTRKFLTHLGRERLRPHARV